MQSIKTSFFTTLLLVITTTLTAQNTRIANRNNIGWYNYFATIKLNKKVSIHTEYQWRRVNTITNWQQGLLRLGINYQVNTKLQLRLGYGNIETFAYGEIPINGLGRSFTEHRIFQVATLTDKLNRVDLSHRFMLEQRFVGRYSSAAQTKEDEFPLLNRLRYMYRMLVPLKGTSIGNKTPYIAAYNEVFIGFGKNVNQNIFDQNRLGVLVGYKVNSKVRIEGGYLNQIVQLGRQVTNRNVFQYNNGLIINANFNF